MKPHALARVLLVGLALSSAGCSTVDDCGYAMAPSGGTVNLYAKAILGLDLGSPDVCVVAPLVDEQALQGTGGVCAGAPGDNACTACLKGDACCGIVTQCFDEEDAACRCIMACRLNDRAASCEEECGKSAAFEAALACTREHCGDQCPGAK